MKKIFLPTFSFHLQIYFVMRLICKLYELCRWFFLLVTIKILKFHKDLWSPEVYNFSLRCLQHRTTSNFESSTTKSIASVIYFFLDSQYKFNACKIEINLINFLHHFDNHNKFGNKQAKCYFKNVARKNIFLFFLSRHNF